MRMTDRASSEDATTRDAGLAFLSRRPAIFAANGPSERVAAATSAVRTRLGSTSTLWSAKRPRQHGKGQGRPEMGSRLALEKRWEMLVAGAAAAMAVTEAIVSIGTEVAWGGFLFAALFAAGAFLIYRGIGLRAALILVAVLCTVGLAFLPFYTPEKGAGRVPPGGNAPFH